MRTKTTTTKLVRVNATNRRRVQWTKPQPSQYEIQKEAKGLSDAWGPGPLVAPAYAEIRK